MPEKKEPPIYANLSQSRSEPLAHFAATESSRLVLLSQPLGGTLDSRFGARRYMQNSFFCERRSASQASRRALAISRETDLWEVESEGTRCDWLRFAWIGGLFQIRRNSKKKYCGKGFLLLPCSLREASHAFQACSRLELLTAFVSQGISKHQFDSVFLINLRCSRVIIDSNNIGIRVIVL